jgi:hypothetical protein
VYHFLYRTTNLVNGKFYIGRHSTTNLDDNYLGSGTLLWKSIRKHGFENFQREILEFVKDEETLLRREKEVVNEELLLHPQCMNLMEGSWGMTPFSAKLMNEALGKEGRSNRTKKQSESLGIEGRKARAKKILDKMGEIGRKERAAKSANTLGREGLSKKSQASMKTMGPEGLSLKSKKAKMTMGPEKCSEIARKAALTLGSEGRSARARAIAESKRRKKQLSAQ